MPPSSEELEPQLRAMFFAILLGPAFAKFHRVSPADLQAALDTYRLVAQHIKTGEDFVKPGPAVATHAPRPPAGWPAALMGVGRAQPAPDAVPIFPHPGTPNTPQE